MRISDWSSDVCSSDLLRRENGVPARLARCRHGRQRAAMKTMVKRNDLVGAVATHLAPFARQLDGAFVGFGTAIGKEDAIEARCTGQAFGQLHRGLVVKSRRRRSEEHTSELQSLMRISYA